MHSQDRDELDELGESKSDQHHEPRRQPVGEGGGSRSGRRGKRRSGVCFAFRVQQNVAGGLCRG